MSSSDNFPSYPPFFRPNQVGISPESGLGSDSLISRSSSSSGSGSSSISISISNSLPVIDLESLKPAYLREVCREWGMFRLTNHGVPGELLSQLHDHANTLFSRSFEFKQGLPSSNLLYFWGSPAITMSATANAHQHHLNWIEGFNVPLSSVSHLHFQDPILESFRCLLEEYGGHQTRLAKAIFTTMAEDLSFPPKKRASYLSPATGILRVYRYPRCPPEEQRWGINEHTDSSVISIIHQDQVGGLQVCKNNEWLDVKPIHDTLIVNLGDMMQAMSDDEYVSVTHRVKVNKVKERVSIGYFVFPAEDAVIESPKYNPFTYADFQAKKELDLKTVGMKIGLPRFRKDQSSPDGHI